MNQSLNKIPCVSFLLFVLTVLVSLPCSSRPYYLDDHDYNIFDPEIRNYIEYFEDTTGTAGICNIIQYDFHNFEDYKNAVYHPGSKYWFKIVLINDSRQFNYYLFEVLHPYLDEVDGFYINQKDTIRLTNSGSSKEFWKRPIQHKNFVFPINANYQDTIVFYFAYRHSVKSSVRVTIRPAKFFIEYALSEYYFLGLFYGVLLIMMVYNLFIYYSTREGIYLYYIFYVFCYLLNSYKVDGIGFQFIWPTIPVVNNLVYSFSPVLLVIGFYFYSVRYLSLKAYMPMLLRYLDISLVAYCLLAIVNYFLKSEWISFVYLIPFVIIYLAGVITWRRGNEAARYFLLAFSFFVLSFTVFVFRGYHILPTNIYTIYSLNFGFIVEVILFSYGMGQRIRVEREKKAKADELLIRQLKENEQLKDSLNKELEIKVSERTKEVLNKSEQLASAYEELKIKNLQIEELNKLLERDNKLLESDNQSLNQNIKEINQARFLLKDLSLEEFQRIYPDEESCLKYLAEVKWSKPYICKKCGFNENYAGKAPFSKRCCKCHYDESVTAFSIFHNSKMDITTAFYLTYLVVANKDISSHQLSEKLHLRQKTCWAYKKKILEIMEKKTGGKWNSKDWGKLLYS